VGLVVMELELEGANCGSGRGVAKFKSKLVEASTICKYEFHCRDSKNEVGYIKLKKLD